MNKLKSVIKENRKGGKEQKKKKDCVNDELEKLITEVKSMATANMQTDDELDSSATSDNTESALCGHCSTLVGDGICCDFCEMWFHYDEECSGVENVKNKQILKNKHILYVCDDCNKTRKSKKEMPKTNCNINNQKLNELKADFDQMHQQMNNMAQGLYHQIEELAKQVSSNKEETEENQREKSYAEKLKTKNTLVIKSNDGDNKAVQKKKAIMSKITTQVDEVKDSKVGHLIVKFADKGKLENARKEFEENINDINISVVEKEKIKPKIKVCNVDADVDDVIEDIKERNKWINDYIQEEEDFKLVKELNTREENNRHYIIKCTPEIRKQIFIRGEILYTLYKKNKVFDSYNVYQCFKCQGFNHSAKHCEENQVCAKCGGNHRLVECNTNVEKCVNCERKGHSDLNHRTNGTKCPVYKEEVSRIKNRTDHGC